MLPAAEISPISCKILLLGDTSVGKSSLVVRFADRTWLSEETRPTVGVDYRVGVLPAVYALRINSHFPLALATSHEGEWTKDQTQCLGACIEMS